ncbi:MAG: hypothetical protein NVS9B1_21340 [Candidatus Dormibacteraceae bacterium]
MYGVLLVVLHYLHVFFGIFWFGAVLTIDFLVVPTVQSLAPGVQSAFGGEFARRAPRLITAIAGTTIVLGLIRGIAGGVLFSLGSAYGLTWIAALILGIGLAIFGVRVITPAAERLQQAAQGPEFEAALARIKRLTVSELGGFVVILGMMVAMRFGY